MQKTFILILLFVSLSLIKENVIIAQEDESGYPSGCVELIMFTANAEGQTLYFGIENQRSIVWDYDFNINPNFSNSTVTTVGNIDVSSNAVDITGWEFSYQYDICPSAPGRIGYSKYKISHGNRYFYIDYRDCRFWKGINGYSYASSPDVWILYDLEINTFYRRQIGLGTWIQISNGSTLNIWDIFNQSGSPNVEGFQPTTPTGLQIINSSGNPQLLWTASEPATAAKYHVYRNNVKITGTPVATTSFIDYDVAFGSNIHQTYKIQAVSGDGSKTSPGYSNSVTINAAPADKNASFVQIGSLLNAKNYPNPFNPSTTIQYELSVESFVTVNVFDMLGREVEQLVNEYQTMGFKTIHFDSKNLPAGIYYYSIRAGSKSDIKSMIVLK